MTARRTGAERMRAARARAARVWRSRLNRLATIWVVTAALTTGSALFVRGHPFYRNLIAPFWIVLPLLAVVLSWQTLRRRAGERRGGDRRHESRRAKRREKQVSLD